MTSTPATSQKHAGIVGMSRSAYARALIFFLAPAVLVYSLFSIYPLIDTIISSFYTRQDDGSHVWNGVNNFTALLTDPTWSAPFWNAFWNNVKFFLIHMFVQNPIGLLLAALLSLPVLRFRAAYRTLIFMPTMLSVVVIGFSWQLILSPLWGIAKMFLQFFGLGFSVRTLAGGGINGPPHHLPDFRVAIRRHSDDPDLHGTAGHSG